MSFGIRCPVARHDCFFRAISYGLAVHAHASCKRNAFPLKSKQSSADDRGHVACVAQDMFRPLLQSHVSIVCSLSLIGIYLKNSLRSITSRFCESSDNKSVQ